MTGNMIAWTTDPDTLAGTFEDAVGDCDILANSG